MSVLVVFLKRFQGLVSSTTTEQESKKENTQNMTHWGQHRSGTWEELGGMEVYIEAWGSEDEPS